MCFSLVQLVFSQKPLQSNSVSSLCFRRINFHANSSPNQQLQGSPLFPWPGPTPPRAQLGPAIPSPPFEPGPFARSRSHHRAVATCQSILHHTMLPRVAHVHIAGACEDPLRVESTNAREKGGVPSTRTGLLDKTNGFVVCFPCEDDQ